MKKEKILSFTLYVFCILALFYGTVMLFQANTQIATYNMSSYVPMTLGEKIQFLFSNSYVPFFFAVITYALGNIVDMLHAMKNPVETKAIEKADAKEEVVEEENVSDDEAAADQEPVEEQEAQQSEDTVLESETEKTDEDPAQTETAATLSWELPVVEIEPADDTVTEEATVQE